MAVREREKRTVVPGGSHSLTRDLQFARYNALWRYSTRWAFSGTEIPFLGKFPAPLSGHFRFSRMLPEYVWDAGVLEGNPFTFPKLRRSSKA